MGDAQLCGSPSNGWQGHAMDGMDKTSLSGCHDAKNFIGIEAEAVSHHMDGMDCGRRPQRYE